MEEKRAFTLVPIISASGGLLPMQTIYFGQMAVSCPSKKAAQYDEAAALGFKFEPSKSGTYWSMQATMRSLVNDIIVPYLDKKKETLGPPQSQCSFWTIGCWSVHRSEEFLSWMNQEHPTIIICFVPGGCTGLWQPLDIGIQPVIKQSMKRTVHRDIVNETTTQLNSGISATMLKLDTMLGTLRNWSVGWLVNAYHDIDNEYLILSARQLTWSNSNSYLTLSPNRPSRCVVLVNLTSHKLA
jgi:hypothetical protein